MRASRQAGSGPPSRASAGRQRRRAHATCSTCLRAWMVSARRSAPLSTCSTCRVRARHVGTACRVHAAYDCGEGWRWRLRNPRRPRTYILSTVAGTGSRARPRQFAACSFRRGLRGVLCSWEGGSRLVLHVGARRGFETCLAHTHRKLIFLTTSKKRNLWSVRGKMATSENLALASSAMEEESLLAANASKKRPASRDPSRDRLELPVEFYKEFEDLVVGEPDGHVSREQRQGT